VTSTLFTISIPPASEAVVTSPTCTAEASAGAAFS